MGYRAGAAGEMVVVGCWEAAVVAMAAAAAARAEEATEAGSAAAAMAVVAEVAVADTANRSLSRNCRRMGHRTTHRGSSCRKNMQAHCFASPVRNGNSHLLPQPGQRGLRVR